MLVASQPVRLQEGTESATVGRQWTTFRGEAGVARQRVAGWSLGLVAGQLTVDKKSRPQTRPRARSQQLNGTQIWTRRPRSQTTGSRRRNDVDLRQKRPGDPETNNDKNTWPTRRIEGERQRTRTTESTATNNPQRGRGRRGGTVPPTNKATSAIGCRI